jgi:hypothetical protein
MVWYGMDRKGQRKLVEDSKNLWVLKSYDPSLKELSREIDFKFTEFALTKGRGVF